MLLDSSLPHPHGHPSIGTAINGYHNAATTGVNMEGLFMILGVLFIAALTFVVLSHRH